MARVNHGLLYALNCLGLCFQRGTSVSRRNKVHKSASCDRHIASESLESRVLLTSSQMAVASPILISGTTGSDVFSVTYSTTTTTVRISSNGSTPPLVGTYSPGIPLSIAGLFGSDAVKVIGTAGK